MKKVILITGASSGLGRGLAQYLANKGFCVYAGMRQSPKDEKLNPELKFVRLDVTSEKDCQEAVKQIIKDQGQLDVVINNAGVTLKGPSLTLSPAEFITTLDTNVVGALRVVHAAAPHLRQSQGRLINITSLNGFVSMPNFGLYCASKFALEALGTALRYELAPDIKVTNVAPGAIKKSASEPTKARTARDKFPILKILLPMANESQYVESIYQLIISDSSPAHLFIGFDSWLMYSLKKILPDGIFDSTMHFVWQRK